MIAIHPLTGLPEIKPGDDLAALLAPALAALNSARRTLGHPSLRAKRGNPAAPVSGLPRFARNDEEILAEKMSPREVLVVTQKIVSKAEGRFVRLSDTEPSDAARDLAAKVLKDPRLVELVLSESSEVVRAAPNVLITRHRSGLVMANAGIDQSNLGIAGEETVLLLPVDADASAAKLRRDLGPDAPAIVISDSFGRPWRMGVTGVAIGTAGLPALIDRRGETDRDGRSLQVTQIGLADMLATAALLAMGEAAEGVPAALISGVRWDAPDAPASALVRPLAEDLFR